jgi:hypothetical protein
MKPTPQISSKQPDSHCDSRIRGDSPSYPSTDYNFQSTVEARGSSSTISQEKLPTFRKLSSEFFGAETSREYFSELLLFTVITAVSAWPIVSMIVAVTRLVRNY